MTRPIFVLPFLSSCMLNFVSGATYLGELPLLVLMGLADLVLSRPSVQVPMEPAIHIPLTLFVLMRSSNSLPKGPTIHVSVELALLVPMGVYFVSNEIFSVCANWTIHPCTNKAICLGASGISMVPQMCLPIGPSMYVPNRLLSWCQIRCPF